MLHCGIEWKLNRENECHWKVIHNYIFIIIPLKSSLWKICRAIPSTFFYDIITVWIAKLSYGHFYDFVEKTNSSFIKFIYLITLHVVRNSLKKDWLPGLPVTVFKINNKIWTKPFINIGIVPFLILHVKKLEISNKMTLG